MKGINKVMLIGNAGKEPEYKTLQDGTPVAKLTMATTETFRLKNGDSQSRTDWHTIIVWRGLATFAHQYIKKERCFMWKANCVTANMRIKTDKRNT